MGVINNPKMSPFPILPNTGIPTVPLMPKCKRIASSNSWSVSLKLSLVTGWTVSVGYATAASLICLWLIVKGLVKASNSPAWPRIMIRSAEQKRDCAWWLWVLANLQPFGYSRISSDPPTQPWFWWYSVNKCLSYNRTLSDNCPGNLIDQTRQHRGIPGNGGLVNPQSINLHDSIDTVHASGILSVFGNSILNIGVIPM